MCDRQTANETPPNLAFGSSPLFYKNKIQRESMMFACLMNSVKRVCVRFVCVCVGWVGV